MPYVRRGKCVFRRDTGKKVGCSTSAAKAKKYLKKLYMVEEDEESSEVKTFARLYRLVKKMSRD